MLNMHPKPKAVREFLPGKDLHACFSVSTHLSIFGSKRMLAQKSVCGMSAAYRARTLLGRWEKSAMTSDMP
jgi:hypothetical protein